MYKFAVWIVVAAVVGLWGCAEAVPHGQDDEGADASDPTPDAFVPGDFPDAAPVPGRPDAAPIPGTPDAALPPPPVDAAPPPPPPPDASSGGFCASNADCPAADECCFVAICVVGIEIGDGCLPTE